MALYDGGGMQVSQAGTGGLLEGGKKDGNGDIFTPKV